jgi:hypothetical protein
LAKLLQIKEDMNSAGFTDIAVSLALKSLSQKDMIITHQQTDFHGNEFLAFDVTRMGDEWLLRNQDLLVLREEPITHTTDNLEPF